MDYNLDLWRYTNKLIIIMTLNLMKNGTIIRTVILLMPYDLTSAVLNMRHDLLHCITAH